MARTKSKPRGSKAKEEIDFEDDTEIDDYSEIDEEFSEENIGKQKENNIFGKAYKWLETKYYSFSDWLTKKGINLNKVNSFLEEKGIPAFVVVASLTIVILAIIILLIINFASKTTVEFSLTDFSGNKLSDVDVKIYDLKNKTKFSGTISDGHKARLALKSGADYAIIATKSGFADFDKSHLFTRGEPIIIKFSENVTRGNFKLTVTDSETKKAISKYKATLNYTVSGKSEEQIATPGSSNLISFTDAPLGKSISLVVEADGYQTVSQSITISSNDEIIPIELQFDLGSAQLEGLDARGTILAVSDTGDLLDDCEVTVYNVAGEKIAYGITQLGKFTFTEKAGSVIRFVVTKKDYRTYDSDQEDKTFRLQKSEDTFTATLKKGSSDLRVMVVESVAGPVSDADVSLYNLNGNLISEKTTLLDGEVTFTGLDKNKDYVVTACKEDYLCSQYFANIDTSNDLEVRLVKFGSAETYKLSIYVYDGANMPLSSANVLIYKLLNGKYVPIGLGPLQVDITGYAYVFTQKDETYKVVGIAGDSNASQEITIDQFKDNKVILIINDASKEVTLQLKDIYGNPVTDGYVTVKTKTGEILYEGYIDSENPAKFLTKGYKDLIVEYIDGEGNVTVASGVVGDGENLSVSLKPMIEDLNPIVSFLEIRDLQNKSTSILSKDNDYYLVFDLQLPIEVKKCGVHFRAGDDSKDDSENMTYGITGFKADTTNFKYSTTYREGQQSIDYDNVGSPNILNKWLELYWPSESVTNKQIMLKVKATEIGDLLLKYRAWCEDSEGKIHRDPEDSTLGTARNISSRQGLYAETKEKVFKVLETPAECSDNLCVEYRFLDKGGFDYSNETFFGTVDEMYLLELNYYTTQSGELAIDTETDASHPIIGLINYQDTDLFPSSKLDSQETKLSSMAVLLQSGIYKKQYLLFNAKNTGVTHIDVRSTFNSKVTEKRLTFEIKNKRNLEVNVLDVLPYNTPITVEVKDADNKSPINNALVKLEDEFGDLISSTKKAKAGKYIINQNFSSTRPNLEVTAPGYAPYTRQLMIADTGIISGPDSISINFGNEISQEIEIIKLVNKGNAKITDLTYKITPIDEVAELTIEAHLPVALNPTTPSEIEVVSVIDPKIKFTTAKYVLTIFGFVGNKQVAKDIEINIYKGQVQENCLDIKPLVIYSYVGISEGSENEITATLVNNCKKAITITPELLKAKGTVIKKDENLEVILPSVTIEPNEEITDYTITIKNNKARKTTKSYAFEIAWRNAYYALPNTKLNIDLVDYSKTIKITPPVSVVSMSQYNEEIMASNKTIFSITNTGKYPLKDIQISRLEEKYVSNIQDKIEPLTFEEIKPGQTKQVSVIYEGKVSNATTATMYYKVSAISPGTKDPITAKFTVDFRISSASCLKVDQKKITFHTKIGEEKPMYIRVTNQCAEPIAYIDYDPHPYKSPNDFTMVFGEGTGVALVPATPVPFIGVGQTVAFYLKVKPTRYFTPRTENRFTLIGYPVNGTALSMVTSEIIWISTEVEAPDEDTVADLERIDEDIAVKICDTDEKMDIPMPKIVTDCKDDGYCDAEGAAELILEKIQELHKVVIDASRQLNNELAQTSCSIATAQQNGCAISDLLKSDQLKPFKNIPIYLQNDSLSQRTLDIVLKNTKEVAKYPTIKNYEIREYVGPTSGGLQMIGNIIHVDNKMQGCGRYKITIDGRIATKDQKTLAPEKAYFYVTIDYNKTGPCAKSIENVRMYLPKDTTFFKKSNMGNTWLTLISGDEKFGKTIAKQVFDSDERFQLRTDNVKNFSQLDVSIGTIKENENAIAKLYFNDPVAVTSPRPEKINLIVNDTFSINKEGEESKYSEEFIKQVSENVKDIINGTPADICISKDKNYMLILSFEAADYGALSLKAQNNKLQLAPLEKCVVLTANSALDEQVKIKAEEVIGVRTKLIYQGKDYTNELSLVLEKDKPTDFNVCFLGDIGDVAHWSDKTVKITAESKFKIGKLNSERKADVNITLLNYGITPMQLIGIGDNISGKLSSGDAESNEQSIYAFVSWNKEYNKNDKEEYCDALKKYYDSLGGKATMFVKPKECEFKETQSEKSARNKRALKRAGTYFTGCMLSCATLTSGVNIISKVIPIFGHAKLLKDLIWNCGIGCGLPTVTMYGNETGITEKVMDVIHKIPVVGDLARVVEKIFGFVGNALGAVANAIMGGGSGKAEADALAQQLAKDGYSGDLSENAGAAETIVGIHDLTRQGIGQVDPFDYTMSIEEFETPLMGIMDDLPDTINITGGGSGTPTMFLDKKLVHVTPKTITTGTPFAPIKSEAKLIKYIEYTSRHPNAQYWFYAKTRAEQTELNRILRKIGIDPLSTGATKASIPNSDLTSGFYKLTKAEQQRFGEIIANNTSYGTGRFNAAAKDGFWANPRTYPDEKALNGKFKPNGVSFKADVDDFLRTSGSSITTTTITQAERTRFISDATEVSNQLKTRLGEVQSELKAIGTPKNVAETQRSRILTYQEKQISSRLTEVDDLILQVNGAPIVGGQVDVSGISTRIDSAGIGSINKQLDNIDKVLKHISSGSGGGPRVMTLADSQALQKSISSTSTNIQSQLDEIATIKMESFGNVPPTDPALKLQWDELVRNESALNSAKSQIDDIGKGLGGLTPDSAGNVVIDSALEGKIRNVSTIKTDIASANSALTGMVKSSEITKMTTNQLDDAIARATKSAASAGKQLTKINAEIVALEKNRIAIPAIKRKRLETLYKQKLGLEDAGQKLTNAADDLRKVKAGASGSGMVDISDDIVKGMDDAVDSIKSLKLPTKLQKFLKGAGKFAIDMIIVAVSNQAGQDYLNRQSNENGQLANLVYLGIPVTEFEKNVWYKVTVIKQANKYDVIIEKEIPAISNDVAIYYTDNKEIKEIQTSEHQEELLQANTPQVQSQDWSEIIEEKIETDATQVSTSLEELQMRMYTQHENKLQDYARCTFSEKGLGSVCVDVGPMVPHHCASFVTEVSNKLYGANYNSGNACDNDTGTSQNYGTRNRIVWQKGKDNIESIDNVLVPGVVIGIEGTSKKLKNCQPPHVVLYVGKNENGEHMILQQNGDKGQLSPLFSTYATNKIFFVVVPRSGYATYDNFAMNNNLS